MLFNLKVADIVIA